MNDLVERLRTRPTGDPHIHAMVHEAADEISRLRARIARLEEALRFYAYDGTHEGGIVGCAPICYDLGDRARIALEIDALVELEDK